MVLCCFGGQRSGKERLPATQARAAEVVGDANTKNECSVIRKEPILLPERSLGKASPTVAALRCHLAVVQGSWLARAHACVDSVLATLRPLAQVSLFGASPCGTALVSIASGSPSAPSAALSPGLVLPMPWPACMMVGRGAEAATPLGKSVSGDLMFFGAAAADAPMAPGAGSAAPEVLVWQVPSSSPEADHNATARMGTLSRQTTYLSLKTFTPVPAAAAAADGDAGACLAPCEPPEEWRSLLQTIANELLLASAASTPAAAPMQTGSTAPPSLLLWVALIPIRLGSSLVGALLLVPAPPPAPPPSPAPSPPPVAAAAALAETGSSLRQSRVAAEAMPTAAAAAATVAAAGCAQVVVGLPEEWSRELLTGVAAAVAECCLGPHLTDIQRATAAANEVATAADIQGLASAFSASITEALSSELHVDFAVRVALVPQVYGVRQNGGAVAGAVGTNQPCTAGLTAQYGFMLTEQPQASVPQHQQATSSMTMDALAARGSMQGIPSRGSLRITNHQPAIERVLAQAGSRQGGSFSSLASAWESVGGGVSPSLHHALMTHGSTAAAGLNHAATNPNMVMSSGTHSFHLPGPGNRGGCSGEQPVRTWKARPFSLESTLFAALAAKTAARTAVTAIIAGGPGIPMASVPYGGNSPAVTMSTALSGFEDVSTVGPLASANAVHNAHIPSCRTALASAAAAGGSSIVSTKIGAIGGIGGGGGRVSSSAVPHVPAYVNDTDQPSGDVMLLFRTGGGGGGNSTAGPVSGRGTYLHSGAASMAGGGAAAVGGPASLILVVGCVDLPSCVNSGGTDEEAQTALARFTAPTPRHAVRSRPTTGNGMGTLAPLSSPPSASALWPFANLNNLGGGGGAVAATASGDASVWIGLYLTCQDRLPTSLLLAARDRAQLLLELLLPAAAACLADAAYSELQYMCDAVGGGGGGSCLGPQPTIPIIRMNSSLASGRQQNLATRTAASPLRHTASDVDSPTVTCAGASAAVPPAVVASVVPMSALMVGGGGGGEAAAAAAAAATAGSSVALHNNSLHVSLSLRGSSREVRLGESTASVRGGVREGAMESETMLARALEGATSVHLGLHTATLAPTVTNTITITASAPTTAITAPVVSSNAPWLALPCTSGFPTSRDASEPAPQVPRSRLSQMQAATGAATAAATGAAAAGGGGGASIPTGSSLTPFLISSNSLVSALMGSGSHTGKTPTNMTTGGAGGGAGGLEGALDSIVSSGQVSLAQPRVTRGPRLAHSPSGLLNTARSSNRMPRQHVSELLASMPCGVYDTLTVMRTNMDVLVSSFWNTLRSQNTEATPSPHADEDLRFLRLTKILGGGGCSTVYSGMLHGLEVAVKVMKAQLGPEDFDDAAPEETTANTSPQSPSAPGTPAEPSPPSPAARQAQLRALMRGARELAVMTSISHPNIVQIYSYHTRVLVQSREAAEAGAEAGGGGGGNSRGGAGAALLPKLLPVAPDADLGSSPGPLQTVLIMECCDLGSLADALDSGMFANAVRAAESARWRAAPPRRSQTISQLSTITSAANKASTSSGGGSGSSFGRAPSGSRSAAVGGGSGIAMHAVYLTLLEVALALRHMHSLNLVHCDVKPANVLLKSSASDPRGFTCKLTDFGFVNLLQYQLGDADDPAAKPSMRYHEPVGTVTHLAPETMVQGSKLDHTVDIFAFGILMWEVFTGKAPYAEHAGNNFRDVPYLVVRDGMRPVFPPATPTAFKSLAQACWSADASRRPTAATLVGSLQRLMDTAASRGAC